VELPAGLHRRPESRLVLLPIDGVHILKEARLPRAQPAAIAVVSSLRSGASRSATFFAIELHSFLIDIRHCIIEVCGPEIDANRGCRRSSIDHCQWLVEDGNELVTHPYLLTSIDGIVEDPQVAVLALDLDAAGGFVIIAMYVFVTSRGGASRCPSALVFGSAGMPNTIEPTCCSGASPTAIKQRWASLPR
jgi:hypothetical protein